MSPLSEYVLAALNRRLEGLSNEQRVTCLQVTSVSEQVDAAEKERECLRAYHSHIMSQNIEIAERINELERKKAELQRKVGLFPIVHSFYIP